MRPITRHDYRVRRHFRVRHKVVGTAERPRLCVFRSNRYVYLQMIDDSAGQTLLSASTLKEGRSPAKSVETCEALGHRIGREAKEKGIEAAVFDRGGFKFGRRLQALVDAVRAEGVKI